MMFAAAYEPTGTTLVFLTHVLVNNKKTLENIRSKIRDVVEENGKIEFENLNKLE